MRNRPFWNVVISALLIVGVAAGCGGGAEEPIIYSGSGEAVPSAD